MGGAWRLATDASSASNSLKRLAERDCHRQVPLGWFDRYGTDLSGGHAKRTLESIDCALPKESFKGLDFSSKGGAPPLAEGSQEHQGAEWTLSELAPE